MNWASLQEEQERVHRGPVSQSLLCLSLLLPTPQVSQKAEPKDSPGRESGGGTGGGGRAAQTVPSGQAGWEPFPPAQPEGCRSRQQGNSQRVDWEAEEQEL